MPRLAHATISAVSFVSLSFVSLSSNVGYVVWSLPTTVFSAARTAAMRSKWKNGVMVGTRCARPSTVLSVDRHVASDDERALAGVSTMDSGSCATCAAAAASPSVCCGSEMNPSWKRVTGAISCRMPECPDGAPAVPKPAATSERRVHGERMDAKWNWRHRAG